MSNARLVERIESSLAEYRAGNIDLETLISAITEQGSALEMMPYALVKEIDEIEYQLTASQFSDEDKSLPSEVEAITRLTQWLSKVPTEN